MVHACRKFFEAVYNSLVAVLDEAFERIGSHQAIERELGRLFRLASRHPMYKDRLPSGLATAVTKQSILVLWVSCRHPSRATAPLPVG